MLRVGGVKLGYMGELRQKRLFYREQIYLGFLVSEFGVVDCEINRQVGKQTDKKKSFEGDLEFVRNFYDSFFNF